MTSMFKTPSHERGVLHGCAQELRRLSAIEIELELTRQTHLSVVQRLQAEIDRLKQEAEKDAKYAVWINRAADERAEADARAYNCGEL